MKVKSVIKITFFFAAVLSLNSCDVIRIANDKYATFGNDLKESWMRQDLNCDKSKNGS